MAISRLHTEITELVTTQRTIREQAQSLPEDQRREVQPEVDAASDQTRQAVRATRDLEDRRNAGQQVDEQEVDQVRRQSDQAAAAQQQASDRVRTVTATERPAADDRRHAAIERVVREQGTERVVVNDDSFVTHGQLRWHLDQVTGRINGVDAKATKALASARASASSLTPLRRATSWALIAFVVVGVLYLLITGPSPIEHIWRDNFAWAFGAAFIAFCVGVITAKDASATAEARSEAHTDHQDDNAGLDIVHRRDETAQYPAQSRSPRATADAPASTR
jgi:hypothetical protein